MTSGVEDLSVLLRAVREGERDAEDRLFALVYRELQRIAHRQLLDEPAGQSLQTTALVNEAYLRLAGSSGGQSWENRRHFFWAAAESMRRILVDRARSRRRLKRGGDRTRLDIDLDHVCRIGSEREPEILDLDDALTKLEAFDPRKAKIVQLRYFVGLTVEETAEIMEVSPRTVKEEWRVARLWLYREINGGTTCE